MKDPRLDENKVLIRAWGMLSYEERVALAEYFGGNGTPDSLAETLGAWSEDWIEELRAEKAAIKPGTEKSNIIPFPKRKK